MNPDSMAKFRTEKMKEELDLTAEQLPKIEQINLRYAGKLKELREEMKQLEEERRNKFSGILTKEQLEKLKSRRSHHHRSSTDSIDDDAQ